MRTRDKQRIFKRFFRGESVYDIALSVCFHEAAIESIIREGVKAGWDDGRAK